MVWVMTWSDPCSIQFVCGNQVYFSPPVLYCSGGKPLKCLPDHLRPQPSNWGNRLSEVWLTFTFPVCTSKPRVHPKSQMNGPWTGVCAWTQLDRYLLWDHIRRCSWLFTTMTFSVSLRGPSLQASETWALCYNAPLCPLTYGILALMWPWKILRMSSCSKKHLNLPKRPLGLMARAQL